MNRYLINVVGCIEPELLGPFKSEATRSCKARVVQRENTETDALLCANVKRGKLVVGAYPAAFFDHPHQRR